MDGVLNQIVRIPGNCEELGRLRHNKDILEMRVKEMPGGIQKL